MLCYKQLLVRRLGLNTCMHTGDAAFLRMYVHARMGI